jgi:hypothetical protein
VIIYLKVVRLDVDSVLNINKGLKGHIRALAFKDRLKKIFNLVRAVLIKNIDLSTLIIIISAGSLFIKDPKVSEKATKLISISVKGRNVNELGLFDIGRRDS